MTKDKYRDKEYEGIAAFVGVSGPETPKYLLTNNFLLEYFEPVKETESIYEFERFVKNEVLYTEDTVNEELLQKSFDRFLKRYLGEESIREENHRLAKSKHYYFPIVPEMLAGSTMRLRHLLYYLQALDKKFDFAGMQRKLADFIFNDYSGINHLLKVLLQSRENNLRFTKKKGIEDVNNFWNMLTPPVKRRMERLGIQLNEDLNVLLTHDYFRRLDFYRRYNYLSVLLTSYVIQYIVRRKGDNTGILCKGNSQDERLTWLFHRACCNNYIEIRNLFPDLLREYYGTAIRQWLGEEKEELVLKAKGDGVEIENVSFSTFVEQAMAGRKMRISIDVDQIKKIYALEEETEKSVSIDEFVLRYIDMTGTRRGSSLTKISSVLPTSGRQIEMIFPNSNARNKYFAMSGSLTEFYVRLYLAGKNQKYDYLDNFIVHLRNRYRILLVKSMEGDKLLKNVKPKLPAKDFAKNKEAFMNTLSNANCLIKLSDSGYVITLPEQKGDLKLL